VIALLYEVVKRGDKGKIEALLAKGVDVNAKNDGAVAEPERL
jgi:hypothetical protein